MGTRARGSKPSKMGHAGLLLLTALLAAPAYGQTQSGQTQRGHTRSGETVNAQTAGALTCGLLKAESSRTASTSHWTISGPSGKTTETAALRSGPRFECLEGAILVVEFTSTAGHSFFDVYFADGTNIGYGRQQIDRRGGRFVLP